MWDRKLSQRKKHFCDLEIFGLDESATMASIAVDKNPNTKILIGNHNPIPFEDDFFDFIYIVDVLHQIEDINFLFNELSRVLKSGGKICVATETEAQLEKKYWNQYFPEAFLIDNKRFHNIDEIIEVCKSSGFSGFKRTTIEEIAQGTIPSHFARISSSVISYSSSSSSTLFLEFSARAVSLSTVLSSVTANAFILADKHSKITNKRGKTALNIFTFFMIFYISFFNNFHILTFSFHYIFLHIVLLELFHF